DREQGASTDELGTGGPTTPASPPFVRTKCLDTFRVAVSISTNCSSIMHTEYCRVPSEFNREPCGIAHVPMRAISVISSVATTDTLEGTMSPWRLKLTT